MDSADPRTLIANHRALIVLNNLGVKLLEKRDLQSAKDTFADALHFIKFVMGSPGSASTELPPDINAQVKKAQSLVSFDCTDLTETNMIAETTVAGVTHFLQGSSLSDPPLYQVVEASSVVTFSFYAVRMSIDESFDYSGGMSVNVESAIVLFNTAIALLCICPSLDTEQDHFRLRAANLFRYAQRLLQYQVQQSTSGNETAIGLFCLEIAVVQSMIRIVESIEKGKLKQRLRYLFDSISLLKNRQTFCFGEVKVTAAEAA